MLRRCTSHQAVQFIKTLSSSTCTQGGVLKRFLSKLSTAPTVPEAFSFSHAIVRGLPNSFQSQCVRSDPSQKISLSRAQQQLDNYHDILRRCGLKVISVPADERYPDCVFIEDTAVVIGSRACLLRPGHPSRQNEVGPVRECLQDLGFDVQEMDDPGATMDGGDVLFTGEEIFVGESTRTNRAGLESLQRAFPELPVTGIPVQGALHLKSTATLLQEGVIVVGGSVNTPAILKVLQEKARGDYHVVHLDNPESTNVLYVNGTTIICTEKELGTDFQKLTSVLTVPWVATEYDEFLKADGYFTCCSIRVQLPGESS